MPDEPQSERGEAREDLIPHRAGTQPDELLWRPPAGRRWGTLGLALGYLIVLGVVVAVRGTSPWDIPGAVVGAGGVVYGLWRARQVDVVRVTADGVLLVNGSMRRFVAWSDVDSVDVVEVEGFEELPPRYPQLRLRDGGELELQVAQSRDLEEPTSRSGVLLAALRRHWTAYQGIEDPDAAARGAAADDARP